MKEHLLPGEAPLCPNCNKKQDGAMGGSRMPQHNDYCVCLYCATICRYQVKDGIYSLRVANDVDYEEAINDGIYAGLLLVQATVQLKNESHNTKDDW